MSHPVMATGLHMESVLRNDVMKCFFLPMMPQKCNPKSKGAIKSLAFPIQTPYAVAVEELGSG
jgi:hypothetical protein